MKSIKKLLILCKFIYIKILVFIVNNFIIRGTTRGDIYKILHPDINIVNSVCFRDSVTLYNGGSLQGKLNIEKNVFINSECFIDYSAEVFIESNVTIGMRVIILSSTHSIGEGKRCGKVKRKTTRIEMNSWIGAGAIIYPGCTIASGCVIAAGEVVYENVPKNKLLKNGILSDIKHKKDS